MGAVYSLINEMQLYRDELVVKAKSILQEDSDREAYIISFCTDWTEQFRSFYMKVNKYAEIIEGQILREESEVKALNADNTEIYEQVKYKIDCYREVNLTMYKTLHSIVIGPVKEAFRFLNGSDRIAFLKASRQIRESYLKIVNYLDAHADAKLARCNGYKTLREEASVIANMDLLARMELTRTKRVLETEQLISSNNTDEKKKIIRSIRDTHNAYFEAYSRYSVERYDYQIILVNFYVQYLDSMMNLGDIAIQEVINDNPSRYEVKKCLEIIQNLISNGNAPAEQLVEQLTIWNRILMVWIQLFKQA